MRLLFFFFCFSFHLLLLQVLLFMFRTTTLIKLLNPFSINSLCSELSNKPCHVWRIGRVDAFRPKGRGFNSRSSPRRDLGQVLHSQLPVALRREIPAQYPCYVGSAPQ